MGWDWIRVLPIRRKRDYDCTYYTTLDCGKLGQPTTRRQRGCRIRFGDSAIYGGQSWPGGTNKMLEIPEHNANIISFLAHGYWNVMIYARNSTAEKEE